MALPDSQATAFAITLLEGNLGDADRTTQIDLIGTMLPFRGVSFPTKMRSKTTYYPGNPVGYNLAYKKWAAKQTGVPAAGYTSKPPSAKNVSSK